MNWRPLATTEVILKRARMVKTIRAFFEQLDYLEVTTPLLMAGTNPDPNLHSLRITGERTLFLQTSPEFAMKRLLAAGSGSIFQICPAFRDDEQGRLHQSEFTLLEWYAVGFDYRQLMQQLEALINRLVETPVSIDACTYRELFLRQLGLDIDAAELPALRQLCVERCGYEEPGSLDVQQCLDLLLAVVIEPAMTGFQFVYDYPAAQSSLARPCPGQPGYVERFELFYHGVELANGFSELTDAVEQRRRFEQDRLRRQSLGLEVYPLDEQLLAALEHGLPDCAGVAVGIERLLMVLLELAGIEDVLLFRD